MNKRWLLITFTALNIFFIGAHVYKHTYVVQLNYTYNRIVTESKALHHEIETLRQKICAHTDTNNIKSYATNVLHMKQLVLAKVKRITP